MLINPTCMNGPEPAIRDVGQLRRKLRRNLSGNRLRGRLLICSVALVASITSKPILTTAQQRDAQQNVSGSQNNQKQASPDQAQAKSAIQTSTAPTSMQPVARKDESRDSANQPFNLWQWFRTSSPTDVLTVLITGILAVAAWRTLDAIRKQTEATAKSADAAKTSADTLKFLERGEVLLNSVSFIAPTLSQDDQCIRFEIQNCGRTRATEVSLAIAIHASPKEPTAVHWQGHTKAAFLVPEQPLELVTDRINRWIGPFEAISKALVVIRFDGMIMFNNVFGESHRIILRGEYNPIENEFIFSQEPWRKT
jgi:hypothetical protein